MLGSLFSGDTNIDGFLLVYDITSRQSLENLEYFDELIEKNVDAGLRPSGSPQPVKIVAGNKCDLSGENRAVSSAEGLAWAKSHGCGFMETSAKAMVNIEETFQTMIRQVVQQRDGPPKETAKAKPSPQSALASANLRVKEGTEAQASEPKKRDCCIIC